MTNEFTLVGVDQKSDELALVDLDVGKYVTILSGIYGQVLTNEGSKLSYKKGSEASVYPGDMEKLPSNSIAAVSSDRNGFFQLALTAGDCQICFEGIQKCSSVTLGAGLLIVSLTAHLPY